MRGAARSVWIGLAVLLLVVFAAVALYAVRSLEGTRESLEKSAEIADEAGVAVSEMKEGVAGIGRGTLGYARTDDPKQREDAQEARGGFERARARYESLAGDTAGREIEALYDEYEAAGESLLQKDDEREAARDRIDGELAEIKLVLGDEARQNVGAREPDSPEKLEETAKMSGAVAGMEGAFEDYLRDPTPERSKAISGNARNFRLALGRFEKLQLDEEERRRADDLRKRFDGIISGIQEDLGAGRTLRADERKFVSLRAELEGALDREAREQRGKQAARAEGSTSQALGRARALILTVLAAVVVALVAVLLVVTGVAARAWRGIFRLARRARRTAGRVFRGDVRVERGLVPLGIALAALLWIAQSLLEAYPLGRGDLPGALLPSRPAEWLGRGAVAAALVASLAYVRFVLGRRSREEGAKLVGDRRERENEARSRLVAVVESSDDAIIGRTLDGVITSWNSGARRLYGYGAEEVVGGYGFELAPPDRLNEMLGLLEKLRRGESVRTYETVHMAKGGRLIDVALTISEIRDSAGAPIGYSTIARDITERKRSEERLRQQKDLYEALLHAQSEVGEGLLILEDGRIVYTNEAFCGISGYGPEELMALTSVLDLVVAEEREAFDERLRQRADDRAQGDQETAILHASGRRVAVETGIKTIREEGRSRLIVILRDITERKRAEEALQDSEEKYRMLVETVQEGFGIIDAEEKITYCNAAYAAIFEMTPQELVGRSLLEFVDEEGRKKLLRRAVPGDPGDVVGSYEITIRTEGGKSKDLSASATPVLDAEGRSQGVVHAIIDITERKRAEEQLAYMARYDHLTGLGNRVLFGDRLARALARADRNEDPVALMFLDLDRFKAINDTLGHEAGDELLKNMARRLGACVRETDTLARMGGDEFAVILEGLADGRDAALVAQKIVDGLAEPFDLDGHEVFVTTSIGIAVSPPSPDEDLVRDADAAMYHAKQLGRNTYQFYTPEMNAQAHERLSLETSLRGALERDEFVLHYQPQVDLATGKIVGAEALLRWQQPYSGLSQPDEFIDVLEESGLIVPVGDWVLRAACKQGKAWEEEGLPPLRVAVNLSSRQFKGALPERLARILDETGIDPSCLELELTESLLMEDAQVTSAMLDELRVRLGLNLSVDDFGTGYSSLSYLKRFPLDALKVDRSFVRDIATDPSDAAIVTSIINLAHNLHLKVIAEGVETEEQLAYLRERGCDLVQGFYFSAPVPAEEFSELVRRDEPLPNFSLRE